MSPSLGAQHRAPLHPLLPAPVAVPCQPALLAVGHVLPVPRTTAQLLTPPRVGPATPFHVAMAARGLQQLIPAREGQATFPHLPVLLRSPTKTLPRLPATFPRAAWEQESREGILIMASPSELLSVPGALLPPPLDAQVEGRKRESLWLVAPGAGGPTEAMGCSGRGDARGSTWRRWVRLPRPPAVAGSSPVAFSLFQFAPRPFLRRGSRLIFLPVSAELLPMQIDANHLLKNSSGW